jgi:hypothetical protein
MKIGEWYDKKEYPKKSGWYLRDYRNTDTKISGVPLEFSVDYFMLDEMGIIGFWYSEHNGDFDDCFYNELPWCKINT